MLAAVRVFVRAIYSLRFFYMESIFSVSTYLAFTRIWYLLVTFLFVMFLEPGIDQSVETLKMRTGSVIP